MKYEDQKEIAELIWMTAILTIIKITGAAAISWHIVAFVPWIWFAIIAIYILSLSLIAVKLTIKDLCRKN